MLENQRNLPEGANPFIVTGNRQISLIKIQNTKPFKRILINDEIRKLKKLILLTPC